MTESDLRQFTSWLGKRSYEARLQRFGITRIREIARENDKQGGRPPKPWGGLSEAGKRARLRRERESAKGGRWNALPTRKGKNLVVSFPIWRANRA